MEGSRCMSLPSYQTMTPAVSELELNTNFQCDDMTIGTPTSLFRRCVPMHLHNLEPKCLDISPIPLVEDMHPTQSRPHLRYRQPQVPSERAVEVVTPGEALFLIDLHYKCLRS